MQSPALHLRWMLAVAGVLWLLVIGINGTAFRVIAAPENQRILQNNVGWERTYKPMIHDRLQPEVVVFGASWARDAFDYEEISALLQQPFFNHAVSGGQPYENRRFLQSALDQPRLQTVVLNIDSFLRRSNQLPFQYGFNEALLNRDPSGAPNAQVAWHRFFAATLSGAAVGNNLSALGLLQRFRDGVPKETLLRAYDRRDFSQHPARVQRWATVLAGGPSGEGQEEALDLNTLPERLQELGLAIRLACARGLRVHTYLTPSHPVILPQAPAQTSYKQALWDFLAPLRTDCPKGLSYWDFAYPNALTLEGLNDGAAQSRYFREDGHPRPTVGQVMAAQMFNRPFFQAPLRDLGADLLQLDRTSARAWIERRQARWRGQWQGDDRQDVLTDLRTTAAHGAPSALP